MSAMSGRARRDDQGAAYTYTIWLTAVTVVLAGLLVNRVAWTAESINQKAKTIQAASGSIKGNVTAVDKLDTTNELAGSILTTAEPLQGKLGEIVRLAQSVDATAKSINSSAGTVDQTAGKIDDTAGTVNNTARGINTTAAAILAVAQSINRGLVQINANLDETIGVVERIKSDTGNVLTQAAVAHKRASCIDEGLGGVPDTHCRS